MRSLGNATFESSSGETEEVTVKLLGELAQKDVAYWMRNSGTSSFRREDDGSTLIVMIHRQGGFHLERQDAPGDDYWVACSGDREELVTLVAGGDPFEVPGRTLLPTELAFRVIRDFCEGRSSNEVEWVNFNDLDLPLM